jgi:hypothetical protein
VKNLQTASPPDPLATVDRVDALTQRLSGAQGDPLAQLDRMLAIAVRVNERRGDGGDDGEKATGQIMEKAAGLMEKLASRGEKSDEKRAPTQPQGQRVWLPHLGTWATLHPDQAPPPAPAAPAASVPDPIELVAALLATDPSAGERLRRALAQRMGHASLVAAPAPTPSSSTRATVEASAAAPAPTPSSSTRATVEASAVPAASPAPTPNSSTTRATVEASAAAPAPTPSSSNPSTEAERGPFRPPPDYIGPEPRTAPPQASAPVEEPAPWGICLPDRVDNDGEPLDTPEDDEEHKRLAMEALASPEAPSPQPDARPHPSSRCNHGRRGATAVTLRNLVESSARVTIRAKLREAERWAFVALDQGKSRHLEVAS